MAAVTIQRIQVYPLFIPLRNAVSHAASHRGVADPVVVVAEFNNGHIGYGETLPRPHVTEETVDSVMADISDVFVPALLEFHPSTFAEALEAIEALPWEDQHGRPIAAARAAIELALVDGAMRSFRRGMDDLVQWMGLGGFGTPGSMKHIRYSGVLAATGIQRTMRQLRLMYYGGMRDFKLKVGLDDDRARLRAVGRFLSRPLAKHKATLRLDANGAWLKDDAIEWLRSIEAVPIAGVEQPLRRGNEEQLPDLRRAVDIPLIHDESLITRQDADRLVALGVADVFNIRISKCGGIIPALRLAGLAKRAGVRIQLGCMVGETSILSAAGLRFLQVCPGVTWAEGCYGRLLLSDDVVAKALRFGLGGRAPKLKTKGLGVEVLPEKLEMHCKRERPLVVPF